MTAAGRTQAQQPRRRRGRGWARQSTAVAVIVAVHNRQSRIIGLRNGDGRVSELLSRRLIHPCGALHAGGARVAERRRGESNALRSMTGPALARGDKVNMKPHINLFKCSKTCRAIIMHHHHEKTLQRQQTEKKARRKEGCRQTARQEVERQGSRQASRQASRALSG